MGNQGQNRLEQRVMLEHSEHAHCAPCTFQKKNAQAFVAAEMKSTQRMRLKDFEASLVQPSSQIHVFAADHLLVETTDGEKCLPFNHEVAGGNELHWTVVSWCMNPIPGLFDPVRVFPQGVFRTGCIRTGFF